MDYQRLYTDLRTAKMSFSGFMDLLAEVHALGVEKGATTVARSDMPSFFAAAPLEDQVEFRACQ